MHDDIPPSAPTTERQPSAPPVTLDQAIRIWLDGGPWVSGPGLPRTPAEAGLIEVGRARRG